MMSITLISLLIGSLPSLRRDRQENVQLSDPKEDFTPEFKTFVAKKLTEAMDK